MNDLPHKLLIGVHDVMPETLPAVRDIVDLLERRGRRPATLLVVPGRDWRPRHIDELRRFRERGHELAGHGWSHSATRIRGFWHRLHSLTVSGSDAEHLSFDGDGIASIIRRCREWFDIHDLGEPGLYVPPAWAMGRIRRLDVRRLGFRFFEYANGYYDARIGVSLRVPMVGFQANSALRAGYQRFWNRQNCAMGHRNGWLRVAIHPADPGSCLGADLTALIQAADGQAAFVSEVFENGPPEAARPDRSGRQVQAGEPSGVG